MVLADSGSAAWEPVRFARNGTNMKRISPNPPVLATNLICHFILWHQVESLQTMDFFRPKTRQRTIHIGKISCSQAAASNSTQKPDELNGP